MLGKAEYGPYAMCAALLVQTWYDDAQDNKKQQGVTGKTPLVMATTNTPLRWLNVHASITVASVAPPFWWLRRQFQKRRQTYVGFNARSKKSRGMVRISGR